MNINNQRRSIGKIIAAVFAFPCSLQATLVSKNSLEDHKIMKKSILNPWKWQEPHGFVQGRVFDASSSIIFCAGQTSVDSSGNPVYKGDMKAQIHKSLDNLEMVLAEGSASLRNVVRVTYYVRSMDDFFAAMPSMVERLQKAECKPTSTLIGVASLFHPDILFEIEASAII
ncbi:RidA family protein [Delftia acidovorans]|uniref:RidA family protein n=1 Tax=Delftia acidovorans TaxID=80866 RepID=A0AAJ2R1V4_DELAC|nr:RidA family protein [Delftia acidovorans]MDX4956540.1 RidA family protein [Delftia acidovorans]